MILLSVIIIIKLMLAVCFFIYSFFLDCFCIYHLTIYHFFLLSNFISIQSLKIDDEKHFILLCDTFKFKRQCFISCMNVLYSNFKILSIEEQLKFILCPPTIETAKCVSKFLGIMTKTRSEIDAGLNPNDLNIYIKHVATTR